MQSGASARVNALACTGASSNCCDGVVAEGIPASGVAEEIRPGSCLIGPSVFNWVSISFYGLKLSYLQFQLLVEFGQLYAPVELDLEVDSARQVQADLWQ